MPPTTPAPQVPMAPTPPVAEVTPTTPPPAPPPPVRPAPAYVDESHSHLGYMTLAIVLLIVGLAAGAAGGYYFANLMQEPVVAPVTEQTVPTNDTTVDAGANASTTNPLDAVQTNPFE